jgi:hypothetical protein
LEVRCHRCDRYGRLRLAKLIAEHGADMLGPELTEACMPWLIRLVEAAWQRS